MRILVTETHAATALPAVRALTAAGHEVVRCRDDAAPAFPCVGLTAGACPVEAGVDVALTVRAGPPGQPTPREDGVVCALRRHVPLVVSGPEAPSPFAEWATVCVDVHGDVVAACEAAAVADVSSLSEVALAEVRRALALRGYETDSARVSTVRSARAVKVDVTMPEAVDAAEADAIAVAVADVVRGVEPTIAVIDVRRA